MPLRSFSFLFALSFLLASFTPSAQAKRFKYFELQQKEYDVMSSLVQKHVHQARLLTRKATAEDPEADCPEAVEEMRQALVSVLSRPNPGHENMIAKLMPKIRKELNQHNAFEDTLFSVVDEAIRTLQESGKMKMDAEHQATDVYLLKNFLSEFKPVLEETPDIEKLFIKVRNAKIKIPKSVKQVFFKRGGVRSFSPSRQAKRELESLEKIRKAAKELASQQAKKQQKAKK